MKFVVLSWIWWMICICWYMYFVFYLFMWCLSLQHSISLIMIVSCKLLLASGLYGNVGNIGCRSWVRCRTWRGYFGFFFIFNTDLTRGYRNVYLYFEVSFGLLCIRLSYDPIYGEVTRRYLYRDRSMLVSIK